MTNTKTSDDTASTIENDGQEEVLDIAAGLVVAFLALTAIVWLIPSQTETASSDYDIAADFFPYLASWATLGLSTLLVISRLRRFRRQVENKLGRIVAVEALCWFGIAWVVVYGLATIGFIWLMPLVISSAMVFSGNRTWWLIGLIAITFPILIDQLVWLIFTVDLP